MLTANPTSWLDIYGQFLYSQPATNVHYQQTDAGNLYLQSQILFYSSEQNLTNAAAEQPHTSGSLGAEIRPTKRLRIVESWLTDRLHDAGSAESTQSFLLASLLATTLASNYSQEAVDVFYQATQKLTLRGGYRYVWGDASYAFLPPAGLASSAQEQLRQNIGLGSATFRPSQKISITGEVEGASSSGVYFRTSLYNYQKVRAQVHYQPLPSLSVSADFTLLNNQNPLAGTNYDYSSSQESLSLYWAPKSSKIFDIQGTYSRSDLRSNIDYLDPGTLSQQVSRYRDNAHTGTALIDLTWPHGKRFTPKLAAGGSFFISSGSAPTSYYQPQAKLWLPLGKHMSWFSEWRYYGYGEAFLLYEGFRTHLVTTGVRFTPMNRTLFVLFLSALAAQAAGFTADSARGARLFETLACVQCHSVNGKGGTTGPDLGRMVDRGFTPASLAATMWNHAPGMWAAMRDRQIVAGELDQQAAQDLMAFFYAARFFEKPGDAGRGKRAFESLGCAGCHSLPVNQWQALTDPIALLDAMWNHRSEMLAATASKGVSSSATQRAAAHRHAGVSP